MDAFHDVWIFRDDLKHLIREIPRMGGHEAQTRNAQFRDRFQNGREGSPVIEILAVRIHVLAEQCDFLESLLHEFAAFFEDVFHIAGAFSSPGIGNDAIGAEFVAPIGDVHERLIFV